MRLTLLFLLTLSYSCEAQRGILLGIDGFLTSCIKSAPNIEWLKSNGAWTYHAKSTIEAVSAPGWSSIMCALEPADTGILDNDWIPFWKSGKKNKITPVTGDAPFPCIFEHTKKNKPNLKTNFYYDWDWLRYLGADIGYVDDFTQFNDSYLEQDQKITELSIKAIKDKSFGVLFTYLGSLDEMGHDKGFCDAEYIEHITKIDELVGKILDALRETGLIDSTIIVVTTDHGADPHTKDHGSANDNNLQVPFIVYGPGIKKGYEMRDTVHIADATPTLMKGLGIPPHPLWRGKAAGEAWSNKLMVSEMD